MEIVDLYDFRRQSTGETMVRGNPVPAGRYRNVIHICVFNSAGQMLIQQRQSNAHSFPNLWDVSVGGGVSQGETPQMAATREIREELGLSYDFSQIPPTVTVTFFEGFDDVFIIHMELQPDQLRLQPEEVQDARWATLEEILSMIDNGIFIPYRKSFIDLLFFLRDHKTLHDR